MWVINPHMRPLGGKTLIHGLPDLGSSRQQEWWDDQAIPAMLVERLRLLNGMWAGEVENKNKASPLVTQYHGPGQQPHGHLLASIWFCGVNHAETHQRAPKPRWICVVTACLDEANCSKQWRGWDKCSPGNIRNDYVWMWIEVRNATLWHCQKWPKCGSSHRTSVLFIDLSGPELHSCLH